MCIIFCTTFFLFNCNWWEKKWWMNIKAIHSLAQQEYCDKNCELVCDFRRSPLEFDIFLG